MSKRKNVNYEIAGLIIGIVACIGTFLAVPQVQKLINSWFEPYEIGLLEVSTLSKDSVTPNEISSNSTSTPLSATPSSQLSRNQILTNEVEEFITNYYNTVNSRQYDRSWAMLTTNFQKERSPLGFEDYKNFWDTIEKVEVEDIKVSLLQPKGTSANVRLKLRYTTIYGTVTDSQQLFLVIFDQSKGIWMFEE